MFEDNGLDQENNPKSETDDEKISDLESSSDNETPSIRLARKSKQEMEREKAAETHRAKEEREVARSMKRLKRERKMAERRRDRKRKELNYEKKRLLLVLGKAIADVYTMVSVVQSQIQILQDLREVYHVSFRKRLDRSVASTIRVPVISKQEEQIRAAVRTIDTVVEGRKAFCFVLDDLLKDFKKTNDFVVFPTFLSDLCLICELNTNRYPL